MITIKKFSISVLVAVAFVVFAGVVFAKSEDTLNQGLYQFHPIPQAWDACSHPIKATDMPNVTKKQEGTLPYHLAKAAYMVSVIPFADRVAFSDSRSQQSTMDGLKYKAGQIVNIFHKVNSTSPTRVRYCC